MLPSGVDARRPSSKPTQAFSGGLGRDDPLWPTYIRETEKWDADLVRSWNSNMDVLLVFAALFSAVVTAFLIESSKALQEDPTKTTASGTIETLQLLKAIATKNESYILGSAQISPDPFQPTSEDIFINVMWYLSLSLSLATALVAMLVKQWCIAFLSERLATPCVQSRIRQARYDKLMSWNTNMIVLSIPIALHVALVFFMIGLSAYLKGLHYLVFRCVVTVFGLTALFYFVTTLLALFVPFCPFHNALSSMLQRGIAATYPNSEDSSEESQWFRDVAWRYLSSKVQEERVTHNTTPDKLAGRAIYWMITCSPDPDAVKSAMQSIGQIGTNNTMKALLKAKDKPVMPLVAQRFTSCFHATGSGIQTALHISKTSIEEAKLYSQALANLAAHMIYRNLPNGIYNSLPVHLQESDEIYGNLLAQDQKIDDEMIDAVRKRIECLSDSKDSKETAAIGLAGASAWNEFVDFSGTARFQQGKTLIRLVDFLYEETTPGKLSNLKPMVMDSLFRALIIEAAHWRHDITYDNRVKVFKPLLTMIKNSTLLSNRNLLSTSLATLAVAANENYSSMSLAAFKGSHIAFQGRLCARNMARQYTEQETLRTDDGDALLLLGLTGLLELYESKAINSDDNTTITLIASQLKGLDILDRQHPIHLSTNILPPNFDIRIHTIKVLVRIFSDKPHPSGCHNFPEEPRAHLLSALVEKLHIWSSLGEQLIRPVFHMINHADGGLLQETCLLAMSAYWLVGQPHPKRLHDYFQHRIPSRLLEIIRNPETSDLVRVQAIAEFDSFTRQYRWSRSQATSNQTLMFTELKLIALNGLFGTLNGVLFRRDLSELENMKTWRTVLSAWVRHLDPSQNGDVLALVANVGVRTAAMDM